MEAKRYILSTDYTDGKITQAVAKLTAVWENWQHPKG